jgi:hypothetical protein
MSIWRGLENLLLVLVLTMVTSLAMAQGTAAVQASKSPNALTCSPAPCVLPNVLVDNLQWGSEPRALVVNPNNPNELVLAAEDGNCASSQGFFSTTDGGSTWAGHGCTSSSNALGEPIVGYGLNNTVYGGGLDDDTAILLHSSTDNGIHWGPSKVVDGSNGLGTWSSWMAVDTHPSSAFKNSIYVSSVDGGTYGNFTQVHVSHSSDGGKHWQGAAVDSRQWINNLLYDLSPFTAVGDDGTVFVTWIRCDASGPNYCADTSAPVLMSKSADGGITLSLPAVIAHATLNPDTPNCDSLSGCLPNTAVSVTNTPVSAVVGSGATAKLYVTFYNWTGTQVQVNVIASTDGGQTFGPSVRVSNSNIGDQFLPWITLSQDGTLAVSWLDRRNDPANLKYQPFLATSADGKSFSRSFRLSSFPNDPSPFLLYYMAPSPALWVGNAVYSTWTDFRTRHPRAELGGVQF